ncbi:hypothetical protein [Acetobacter cerevisiae]|uniref:hypothetical protein n=1 Tax=Acetobacter cerevisiae TaxID=178900 RepID=UPI0020A07427|nr:hypothetical protein [Acetobacter cerevisiae]MCP1271699.1 hypothetical protein [Acetobacter cerevisiae]MCP1279652.1 hypothetical protein [Acetobacter cerevisiae]
MSIQAIMNKLNWEEISYHYYQRYGLHKDLVSLFKLEDIANFSELLVAINNEHANYSASDHSLGPQILKENIHSRKRLYNISEKFIQLQSPHTVPKLIREAGLKYFQIGVGSEASCMLNPSVCWVTNTKTVWAHLLFKYAGNVSLANEALKLYRNSDENSDMAYNKWRAIHQEMGESSNELIECSKKNSNMDIENMNYLWADAISNALYELNQ